MAQTRRILLIQILPLPQSSFDRKARADLRSHSSWYSIPRNISSIRNAIVTPESETILLKDVFQGRETNNRQEDVITSLDMHFNPGKRGPYNYNLDLKNVLENYPENTWAEDDLCNPFWPRGFGSK